MARQAQDSKLYAAPLEAVAARVRAIGQAGLNLSLQSENPTGNSVWFRILHGSTWASWGEKITITLTV